MKKLTKKIIPLLMLLTVCSAIKAQKNGKQTADLTAAEKLSAQMFINKHQASQVYQALTYHRAELERVIKDPRVKFMVKRATVMRIMDYRRHLIDSLLTPAQRTLLVKIDSPKISKRNILIANLQRQHEEEMNRVPHSHKTVANKSNIAGNK